MGGDGRAGTRHTWEGRRRWKVVHVLPLIDVEAENTFMRGEGPDAKPDAGASAWRTALADVG